MRRLLFSLLVAIFALAPLGAIPVAAGGCHSRGVTDGSGTTVEMRICTFTPTIVRIQPGETVTWVNRDGIEHVVSVASLWGGSGKLSEGQSYSLKFDRAGIFPYTCYLHLGMSGAVVVGDGKAQAAGAVAAAPVSARQQAAPAGTAWLVAFGLGTLALVGLAGYVLGRRRSA